MGRSLLPSLSQQHVGLGRRYKCGERCQNSSDLLKMKLPKYPLLGRPEIKVGGSVLASDIRQGCLSFSLFIFFFWLLMKYVKDT